MNNAEQTRQDVQALKAGGKKLVPLLFVGVIVIAGVFLASAASERQQARYK